MEPDIHYTSSINSEFLDGLGNQLDEIKKLIPEEIVDKNVSAGERFAAAMCRENWLETLATATKKLASVYANRLAGIENDAHDRQVVNICLCIIRDFKAAKAKGFKDG